MNRIYRKTEGQRKQSKKFLQHIQGLQLLIKKFSEAVKSLPKTLKSLPDHIRNLPHTIKELSAQGKRRAVLVCLWILCFCIIANPTTGALATSISNQEFFSFHLKDLARGLSGQAAGGTSTADYYLSTGTYEQQLDGPLFGAAKGKNLLVIQVEALQNIMLHAEYEGQEITPNLNKLIAEQGTVYFDHYYQMLGSGNTSDSEFVTNNSILGSIESYTYQLYEDNYYKGLPWLLQEQGYSTAAFHGFDKTFWNRENIYPKLGFQQFINSDKLENDNVVGLDGGNIAGISDEAFFKQSMEYIRELPEPFYGFMVTLSSHHPFKLPPELSGIKLSKKDEGTLFGNYINAIHYADQNLGMFLDMLKTEGLYDETMICIYGDHFGLNAVDEDIQKRVSQFLGKEYKLNNMMNIPLIIHIPGAEVKETISLAAGQVDFLPTVSYLLGLPALDTLYFGQNLFTAKEGFVWEQTHLLKGSFITDDIVFEMARDGVISHSKVWDVNTGQTLDSALYEEQSGKAKFLTELSDFYLKNDVLRKALKDGMSMEEILGGAQKKKEIPSAIYSVTAQELKDSGFEIIQQQHKDMTIVVTPALEPDDSSQSVYIGDLIEFMENHDHIKVMVDLANDPVEILRQLKEVNLGEHHEAAAMRANVMSRLIPVIHNFDSYTQTEYEGFDEIVVVPDAEAYTVGEMQSFINQNQPYAMMLPVAGAVKDDAFRYILKRKDVFTYGYGAEQSQYTGLRENGFEGFMQALPQPESQE